jgi:hypothetical protein
VTKAKKNRDCFASFSSGRFSVFSFQFSTFQSQSLTQCTMMPHHDGTPSTMPYWLWYPSHFTVITIITIITVISHQGQHVQGGQGVQRALGPWPLALGPWPLALGPWPLALGLASSIKMKDE